MKMSKANVRECVQEFQRQLDNLGQLPADASKSLETDNEYLAILAIVASVTDAPPEQLILAAYWIGVSSADK